MAGPAQWVDSAAGSAAASTAGSTGSAAESRTSPRGDTETDAEADSVGEAGAEGDEGRDEEEAAREIVLRQLALQPRSKAELERTLRRRGVPDEVAEQVLGRFSEVGLIDDAAFAQAWVETRHSGRGLARRALAHELRRRGVGDQDIGHAVGQVSDDTELATARALVARRLPATRRLRPHVRIRRLLNLLARKGYSSAVAVQVVREALADNGDDVRLLEELDHAVFEPDDEF